MKMYKVDLYRVIYTSSCGAVVVPVDKIIVQKGLHFAKEILTGYSKINMVPESAIKEKSQLARLDACYQNRSRKEKNGEHLFIVREDLCAKNGVRPEDIVFYTDDYDVSIWKKTYENMKQLSKQEKRQLSKNVREVAGTKR